MPISTGLLSLAGEYAVASQLCRLNHFAQLTFGNRKRTDILVDASNGKLFRVEVKAKQGSAWPSVQAVRAGDFIILVDYQRKTTAEPPDFYVLSFSDWKAVVAGARVRHPNIQVDENHCVTHPDGWKGLNLTANLVRKYQEAWSKLPGI